MRPPSVIAEPSPQHRPAAQRWGRRGVRDNSSVPPARLEPTASSTLVTTFADAETADSPHSGGIATCTAPMAATPTLTRHTGSPLSTPQDSLLIESAKTAPGHDDSPHVVAGAGQNVLQEALSPALSATVSREAPTASTAAFLAGESALSSLPAPPRPPGMFANWVPVPSLSKSTVPDSALGQQLDDVNVVLPQDTPAVVSDTGRSRAASIALMLIIACALGILAVIVLSAVRLSGLVDLGLSSEQLSDRFRHEALVWVPTVAVFGAGLAGASLMRAKLSN